MVHKGVKFSCRFTLKEIAQRWYALLYDPTISRLAVSAMRNLHPETIANIESKALFSIAEEELLATIQSVSSSFHLDSNNVFSNDFYRMLNLQSKRFKNYLMKIPIYFIVDGLLKLLCFIGN